MLTFFAVGVATLIAAGIVLAVLGTIFSITFGLATFLLFKVAPVMLLGWVVLKIIDRTRNGSLSAADRRWLED